jgi:hypothetical protein
MRGRKRPGFIAIVLIVIGVLFALAGAAAGVWVLLSMPARTEITRIEPATEPLRGASPQQPAPTIDDEAQQVAGVVSGASGSWTRPIEGVEVVTRLLRPVIQVTTSLGPEDAQGAETLTTELRALVEGITPDPANGPTYYMELLSADNEVVSVIARTDTRWMLETPPAPTDTAALQGWLSEVYGPGSAQPEAWYARITGISAPAEDPEGYIRIETDLDPAVPADVAQAQWIIAAVDSSGATFAPAVRVRFGSADFEWTSLIDGTDPFAP